MRRGPAEFVVVEFPGQRIDPALGEALRTQVARGVISIVDMLFVQKSEDGSVSTMELSEMEGDEYRAFDQIPQTIDGLISPEDAAEVAGELEAGTSAALVVYEHRWVRELRQKVLNSGGRVAFVERIPAHIVDTVVSAAETEIAEAALRDAVTGGGRGRRRS